MLLCLECGSTDEHARDCSRRPPHESPVARTQRVLHAMAESERVLSQIEPIIARDPRGVVLRLALAERLLELCSPADLPKYEDKRAHRALAGRLAAKRAEVEAGVEGGASLVADLLFAGQAIERLYRLAAHCHEAVEIDVSALGQLPTMAVPPAVERPTKLGRVCAELERLNRAGSPTDMDVLAWGFKNLVPLVSGADPVEIPEAFQPGPASYLGALIGHGPSAVRARTMEQWKALGGRFRERHYLLGANAVLLRAVSHLSRSQDAWRQFLAKDGGKERWERLKAESEDVLRFVLGDWDPEETARVEEVIARLARSSRADAHSSLRSFASIGGDEWEALAKSYFLEFSLESEEGGGPLSMEAVARAILERVRGATAEPAAVAERIASLRKAWEEHPPGDLRAVLAKRAELAARKEPRRDEPRRHDPSGSGVYSVDDGS